MAAVCRFWRISPDEYKRLSIAELNALIEYQDDEIRARKRANEAAKRRRK